MALYLKKGYHTIGLQSKKVSNIEPYRLHICPSLTNSLLRYLLFDCFSYLESSFPISLSILFLERSILRTRAQPAVTTPPTRCAARTRHRSSSHSSNSSNSWAAASPPRARARRSTTKLVTWVMWRASSEAMWIRRRGTVATWHQSS